MPLYARAGVSNAWLVDPLARTIEVYRLERERWVQLVVVAGDAKARAEPFDAVEIDFSLIWSALPPDEPGDEG
jgi:Uma2 family endonuclease